MGVESSWMRITLMVLRKSSFTNEWVGICLSLLTVKVILFHRLVTDDQWRTFLCKCLSLSSQFPRFKSVSCSFFSLSAVSVHCQEVNGFVRVYILPPLQTGLIYSLIPHLLLRKTMHKSVHINFTEPRCTLWLWCFCLHYHLRCWLGYHTWCNCQTSSQCQLQSMSHMFCNPFRCFQGNQSWLLGYCTHDQHWTLLCYS